MSLSNPNKSVTEERLAEFYQSILPYLGGMPEAVCNKFDKANLYSTDEKVIGCWTDGRPIYRRGFTGTFPSLNTGEVDYTWKQVNIPLNYDINDIIKTYGVIKNTAGTKYLTTLPKYEVNALNPSYSSIISVYSNSTNIRIDLNQYYNRQYVVFIEYTKTTDAANSFNYADENDYSTTEKIIGTWIDGSYVYQKTINFGALPNNTRKSVAHGISNYKQTISFQGFAYNRSKLYDSWAIPEGGATTSAVNEMDIWTDQSNIIIATRDNWTDYDAYVTLKYLKTT